MASSSLSFLIFATLIASGFAIHCWVCNSNQNDACRDPFDEQAAKSAGFYKNCDNPAEADPIPDTDERPKRLPKTTYINPESGNTTRIKYTFCRKTVQKASLAGMKAEDKRIVRSCGFLNDTKLAPASEDTKGKLKCYRKVGTFEVEMLYCGCYEDSCNPSARPEPFAWATVGSILIGMIIATRVV